MYNFNTFLAFFHRVKTFKWRLKGKVLKDYFYYLNSNKILILFYLNLDQS